MTLQIHLMIVVKKKRDVILLYKMGIACGLRSGGLGLKPGENGVLGGRRCRQILKNQNEDVERSEPKYLDSLPNTVLEELL